MEDKRRLIVLFWSFFVIFVIWIFSVVCFVGCFILGVALTTWCAAREKSIDLIIVLCEQYTQRIMWVGKQQSYLPAADMLLPNDPMAKSQSRNFTDTRIVRHLLSNLIGNGFTRREIFIIATNLIGE